MLQQQTYPPRGGIRVPCDTRNKREKRLAGSIVDNPGSNAIGPLRSYRGEFTKERTTQLPQGKTKLGSVEERAGSSVHEKRPREVDGLQSKLRGNARGRICS
jgi:hypothetical protein